MKQYTIHIVFDDVGDIVGTGKTLEDAWLDVTGDLSKYFKCIENGYTTKSVKIAL